MRNHPDEAMTIYDIPGNVGAALQKTGIYPFNRNVFNDLDFSLSYVTHQPKPSKLI